MLPSYYHRIKATLAIAETNGVAFGTPSVSEFAYLSGQIVHLKEMPGMGSMPLN